MPENSANFDTDFQKNDIDQRIVIFFEREFSREPALHLFICLILVPGVLFTKLYSHFFHEPRCYGSHFLREAVNLVKISIKFVAINLNILVERFIIKKDKTSHFGCV